MINPGKHLSADEVILLVEKQKAEAEISLLSSKQPDYASYLSLYSKVAALKTTLAVIYEQAEQAAHKDDDEE